jgi:hypothetical protein
MEKEIKKERLRISMTEKQFHTLKLSAICSYQAYQWLSQIVMSMQSGQRYPLPVKDFFYSQTNHRQYLSKFLESVITKLVNKSGNFAKKVETTGVRINTKTGKELWVKAGHKVKGEPDVMTIIDGRTIYFEVKIGNDKLSIDQGYMITRLEKAGANVYVVRTVDEVLEILYNLKIIEK